MKAGFIHGYPNKPTKKRYGYHGFDRDCLIQPEPLPFDEFPALVGPSWVLIHDFDFSKPGNWFYYYHNPSEYPPAIKDSVCKPPPYTVKEQYYFLEVEVHSLEPIGWFKFYWTNGINCRVWEYWVEGTYLYTAFFDHLWYKSSTLFAVWSSYPGSHARIWASSTGERPGYDPVPPA